MHSYPSTIDSPQPHAQRSIIRLTVSLLSFCAHLGGTGDMMHLQEAVIFMFFVFWTDTPAPPRPAPLDMRATGWTWEGRKGYNRYEGKVSIKRCTLLCGAFLFVLDR